MYHILKIISRADGQPTPYDGQYLVHYRELEDFTAELITTASTRKAKRFFEPTQALNFWKQQSSKHPVRPDGKPNRPLTAFNVTVEKLR